jgi:Ca2+-binding RTX toxin-like protein
LTWQLAYSDEGTTMGAIDNTAVGTDAVARVREFYDLLLRGRGDDVAQFVEANFAEDATLSRPESLPGGGSLTGAKGIAKFMRAAASAVAGLTLRSVHQAPSSNEVSVFAEIALNLGPTATTAIEWWTFTGEEVTSLRAYYWDTAAILAAAKR